MEKETESSEAVETVVKEGRAPLLVGGIGLQRKNEFPPLESEGEVLLGLSMADVGWTAFDSCLERGFVTRVELRMLG